MVRPIMNAAHARRTASRGIGVPRARFVTVLGLLLGLIVVAVGLDNRGLSAFLLDLSSAAILFIALVAATEERRHRRTAFVLAALTVLLGGGGVLGFRPWDLATGAVMSAVFAGYTTWRLLAHVLRSRKVTGDVLAGALAARCGRLGRRPVVSHLRASLPGASAGRPPRLPAPGPQHVRPDSRRLRPSAGLRRPPRPLRAAVGGDQANDSRRLPGKLRSHGGGQPGVRGPYFFTFGG